MDRYDLDVGFQDGLAAFNVGEAFVAGDGLCLGDIATRCCKTDTGFSAFIAIAAIVIRLR
jgi:hypothetical protein